MFPRWVIYLFVVLLLSPNIACSVGMAMSGKNNPNLGMVRVGATRGEIELTMGPPMKTVSLEAGRRMDTYQYEIGNEPSGGRAVGHAVMDVLTLGIWEIVGTPIEAVQGDNFEVSIIYDKDDRVEKINQTTKVSPTPPATATAECDSGTESCI